MILNKKISFLEITDFWSEISKNEDSGLSGLTTSTLEGIAGLKYKYFWKHNFIYLSTYLACEIVHLYV